MGTLSLKQLLAKDPAGGLGRALLLTVPPLLLFVEWTASALRLVTNKGSIAEEASFGFLLAVVGGYLFDITCYTKRPAMVADAYHYFAGILIALSLIPSLRWLFGSGVAAWRPSRSQPSLGFSYGFIIAALVVLALLAGKGGRPLKALITVALLVCAVVLSGARDGMALYERDPVAFAGLPEPHASQTDFVYFAVVTFSTVGYGDITPTSTAAKRLVIQQILLNVVVLGVIVGLLIGVLAGPRDKDEELPITRSTQQDLVDKVGCWIARASLIAGGIGALPGFLLLMTS